MFNIYICVLIYIYMFLYTYSFTFHMFCSYIMYICVLLYTHIFLDFICSVLTIYVGVQLMILLVGTFCWHVVNSQTFY